MIKNYSKIAVTVLCISFFWGNALPLQEETTKKLDELGKTLKSYPKDANDFATKNPTSKQVINWGKDFADALYSDYLYFYIKMIEAAEDPAELEANPAYAQYKYLSGQLCTGLTDPLKTSVKTDLDKGTYTTFNFTKRQIDKYIHERINESFTSMNHSELYARAMVLIDYFRPFLKNDKSLIDENNQVISNDNSAFESEWTQITDCAKSIYQAKLNPKSAPEFVATFVFNENEASKYSFMTAYLNLYSLESSSKSTPIKKLAKMLISKLNESKAKLEDGVKANAGVREELEGPNYFGVIKGATEKEDKPGPAFKLLADHFVPNEYIEPVHKALVWGLKAILETNFIYHRKLFHHNLPLCIRNIRDALKSGNMRSQAPGQPQGTSMWQMFKLMLAGQIVGQAVGKTLAEGEKAV